MKKFITLYFLFGLLLSTNLFSQDVIPGSPVVLVLDPVDKDIHIPYSGPVGTEEAVILVNFIEDATSSWPLAAQAAFDHAVTIWSATLESNVPIEIDARFENLGSPNILGFAAPAGLTRNFGSSHPVYLDDVWFPFSLANKLNDSNLFPNETDITCSFNSTFNWYFGTDAMTPATQVDFATVVLHEIGHGVGFISSAGPGGYGANGFPFIYDRFIQDGSGTALIDFPAGTSSTALTSFLTSDDLFWVSASEANGTKLFAPSTWTPGSSISHFDEVTFNGTNHAVMTPVLGFGEGNHNLGERAVGLLSDIGWDAVLSTGIEDVLSLHNFDVACFLEPQCQVNFYYDYFSSPDTEVNVGDSQHYGWWFIDEEPLNGISNISWKFEALHDGGTYELATCNSWSCGPNGIPQVWEFTVPDLPQGYHWLRNMDNQVRGVLTVSGSDEFFYEYEASVSVAINYRPDKPELEFTNAGEQNICNSATVSFYARGADFYYFYFKSQYSPFWFVELLPPGQTTYTVNNLNPAIDYYFKVEAHNDIGSAMSDILTRHDCWIIGNEDPKKDIAGPNPTTGIFMVTPNGGNYIDQVEVIKQDNPGIKTTLNGGPFVGELSVDISNFPEGIYNVILHTTTGEIETQLLVKM